MSNNKLISIIIIVAVILVTLKGASWYYNNQNEADRIALKKEKIKNSTLTKLKEGLYTKLAADTLTIGQLRKVNDSLGLELKDPKVVTVIKFIPREVEKKVDSVVIGDSIINIVDNYPNKDNPFVTYKADINKFTGKGLGKFSFTAQEFRLGIGENPDGTFSINSEVPEFFNITGLDVQALPMEAIKIDNFGWIIGTRVGQNFSSLSNYIKINGGIRYKKLYLSVGVSTNASIEAGIDIEF